jgi:deoxyribose-phosphate aldolase
MDLAKYIDHTFLNPAGDENAVRRLCREAKKFGFCSVCVNPSEVPLAVKLLKKSAVKVCTVIGFPLGQNSTEIKIAEALDMLAKGAGELDFVVNVRLLKYDPEACYDELYSCVDACRAADPKAQLKLIIECCYLTDDEKILACSLAKRAGFDFVKTSTGFGPSGATEADVKLMRSVVGDRMGVKAAGGIRTRSDAEKMIRAGASRLGCSASVAICG